MEIIVYTRPTCVYCDKVKDLLDVAGLSYETKEAPQKDTPEALTLWAKAKQTVPVVVIDQLIIGGYEDTFDYIITKELDENE